jgi:hypothetical protein
MRGAIVTLLLALAALPSGGDAAEPRAAGDRDSARDLEVRVWMDRGHEPVLSRGDRARLYYHVSEDAYLAIFHIDTNGLVRLLYPASPSETEWVYGGRDYRLLFPQSSYWYVEDDPGMGYFFAVASPEPLDFSMLRYSRFEGGWDLARVGRQVYRDPYVAMDDYVAHLIPDWEYVPYALDFTSYHVGASHDYPRFLCYDCHGFRPYSAWNPYLSACVNFRVVVYSDPYYYPVSRYRGTQVVYVRPPVPGQPRFAFKERAAGEASVPLVRRREDGAPPPVERRVVPGTGGNPEGPLRRGTPSAAPTARDVERSRVPERVQEVPARRPSESGRVPPASTREFPTLERRPSERVAPPASSRPSAREPDRTPPAPATRPQSPSGRSGPPGSREQPPVDRSRTPSASPPASRGGSERASSPSRSTPAPSTRSSPSPPVRSSSPPPARGSNPPPARSSPPSTRSSPPPARSSPPPARSSPPAARSSPPPARSSPPAARSSPPPAARERQAPPPRATPGRSGSGRAPVIGR